MDMENKKFWVRLVYSIATCAIAIYAILSFNASTSTSNKVTASLEDVTASLKIMQEELTLMNEPYAKIVDVGWIGDLSNVTCDNPPKGLGVTFMNISRKAIQVHEDPIYRIYFGEAMIAEAPRKKFTKIMAPGDKAGKGIKEKVIEKYLGVEKPELQLVFTFEVKYSRINDKRIMRYFTKRKIHFDCAHLTPFLPMEIIEETITPIKEPAS